MKRYFGGLMVLVTLMAVVQNARNPDASAAVGAIILFIGIPGAIWLFRKTPKP